MMKLPMGKDPTNSGSDESRSLRRIRGIGVIKEKWLQRLLNIRTIQDLAGASAEGIEIARRKVSYEIQVFIRGRTEGATEPLVMTQSNNLLKQQLSYTATLPGISLRPGLYRLQVHAALSGASATPSELKIPLLQVL